MMILLRRRRRWHHHHHHHHRKRYSRSPCPEKVQTRRKKKERRPPRFWKERKTAERSLSFFFRVSSSSSASSKSSKSSKSRGALLEEEVRSTEICGGPFLLVVVVSSKKTREIFFFSFFFVCVWVGVSLSIRNTRALIRTKHRLPSSVKVRQSRVFSFSSCCVYILGFQIMSIFFFKRERALCVRFRRGTKERRNNTACTHTVKHHPPRRYLSHFTQNVLEEEEERHVGRTPVRAASHAQGTTTPTPRATYFFLLSLSL